MRGTKVILYPESQQCHLRRLPAAGRLLPLDRAMSQENGRREWLKNLQPIEERLNKLGRTCQATKYVL